MNIVFILFRDEYFVHIKILFVVARRHYHSRIVKTVLFLYILCYIVCETAKSFFRLISIASKAHVILL